MIMVVGHGDSYPYRQARRDSRNQLMYKVVHGMLQYTPTWFQGHGNMASAAAKGRYRGFRPHDFEQTSIDLFSYMERGFCDMAGKQKSKGNRFGNTEFVNVTLDVEQRKEFKAWFTTIVDDLHDEIGQLMVDDYKVSCSWDDNNQCFIATFTGKPDQNYNSEKALSSRSDNWFEALGLNLFKHIVIFSS